MNHLFGGKSFSEWEWHDMLHVFIITWSLSTGLGMATGSAFLRDTYSMESWSSAGVSIIMVCITGKDWLSSKMHLYYRLSYRIAKCDGLW